MFNKSASYTCETSVDYMQNSAEMAVLTNGISADRNSILQGRRYISIVPCIRQNQIQKAEVINRASLQASVIRAYLKTKCGIPHECIAFAIDTTQNISDVVMVNIFNGELPQGNESGIIKYVLGGNTADIFSKYGSGIPYGNLWMIQERAKEN